MLRLLAASVVLATSVHAQEESSNTFTDLFKRAKEEITKPDEITLKDFSTECFKEEDVKIANMIAWNSIGKSVFMGDTNHRSGDYSDNPANDYTVYLFHDPKRMTYSLYMRDPDNINAICRVSRGQGHFVTRIKDE